MWHDTCNVPVAGLTVVLEGPCLEDEAIFQDDSGEGVDEEEDEGQDEAPHNHNAPRLWQLHQLCDLKAGEVIQSKECQQRLKSSHNMPLRPIRTAITAPIMKPISAGEVIHSKECQQHLQSRRNMPSSPTCTTTHSTYHENKLSSGQEPITLATGLHIPHNAQVTVVGAMRVHAALPAAPHISCSCCTAARS